MPLVIEDGTGLVDEANSYASRAEIINYAANRGVTLIDDATTDVLAIKAMDYLLTLRWKGQRVRDAQPLDFPRTHVQLGWAPVYIPANIVPAAVKRAQMQLALDASTGIELVPSRPGASAGTPFITVDKLGPIETHYSEAIALAGLSVGTAPILTLASEILLPYLVGGGGPTTAYRK